MSQSPYAVVLSGWNPASRESPHARLVPLLTAFHGAAIADDTLGARNRRLLLLHGRLMGGGLAARVTCPHCAVENEFPVPVDAILATPAPDARARIRVRSGKRTAVLRQPRMADIEAAFAEAPGDVGRFVAERCRIAGGEIPKAWMGRIGEMFETLDPAANVVVNIVCSACAKAIQASVDIATFVARDLDRLADSLFRDIDLIAGAYGWSEHAILALPAERRRQYSGMISASRAPARPSLIGRRA